MQTPERTSPRSPLLNFARYVQGKGPVNPVRETVKEILTYYGNADWSKLENNKVRDSARAAIEGIMRNNRSDSQSQVYLNILDILGNKLPGVILQDRNENIGIPDMNILLDIKKRFRFDADFSIKIFKAVDTLIQKYPQNKPRSTVELAEIEKITRLLEATKNAISTFYEMRIASINVSIDGLKKIIRLETRKAARVPNSSVLSKPGGKRSTMHKKKRRQTKRNY